MMIDYTNLIEISGKRIKNTKETFVRSIDNKINWNSRLIGIKGARGCGKTTLLLQHLKNNHMDLVLSGKALFVSLDNIWFAKNSLLDLAESFSKNGGKILYLDEVHRYEDWPIYIKNIIPHTVEIIIPVWKPTGLYLNTISLFLPPSTLTAINPMLALRMSVSFPFT